MNVEVKVIKEYTVAGSVVKVGTKFITDQETGENLQLMGYVKIIRTIPSHTPKKQVSHTPKKKY